MTKSIIKLDGVWKTFDMGATQVHALRGIDLNVKKGEFIAIMGPSGSGKSTAMNLIGCLDIPTQGKIFLDGKDISRLSESKLAQIRGRKIGFIFQKFNLIPTMSAKENVMLPMLFQEANKTARSKKAEELLKLVELGDRMNFLPTELSGGQQQRVAIARSLANDPEVILADEPTGNLDTKTGDTVMNFLERLHKTKGTTVILVTHEASTAAHASTIKYLRDGLFVEKAIKGKRK